MDELEFNQPRLCFQRIPGTDKIIVGCGSSVEVVRESEATAPRKPRLLNVFAHNSYHTAQRPIWDVEDEADNAGAYYVRKALFFPDRNDVVLLVSLRCLAVVSLKEMETGGTICAERVHKFHHDILDAAFIAPLSVVLDMSDTTFLAELKMHDKRLVVKTRTLHNYGGPNKCCASIVIDDAANMSFSVYHLYTTPGESQNYYVYVTQFVLGSWSDCAPMPMPCHPLLDSMLRDLDYVPGWLSCKRQGANIEMHIGLINAEQYSKHVKASKRDGLNAMIWKAIVDNSGLVNIIKPCIVESYVDAVGGVFDTDTWLRSAAVSVQHETWNYFAYAGNVFGVDYAAEEGKWPFLLRPPIAVFNESITSLAFLGNGSTLLIGCLSGRLITLDLKMFKKDFRFNTKYHEKFIELMPPFLIDWLHFDSPTQVTAASFTSKWLFYMNIGDHNLRPLTMRDFEKPTPAQKMTILHSPKLGYVLHRDDEDRYHRFRVVEDHQNASINFQGAEFKITSPSGRMKVLKLCLLGTDLITQDDSFQLNLHLSNHFVPITPRNLWNNAKLKKACRVRRSNAQHIVILTECGRVHHVLIEISCKKKAVQVKTNDTFELSEEVVDIAITEDGVLLKIDRRGVLSQTSLKGSNIGFTNWSVDGDCLSLWSEDEERREARMPLQLHKIPPATPQHVEKVYLVVHVHTESKRQLEVWDVSSLSCALRIGLVFLERKSVPAIIPYDLRASSTHLHIVFVDHPEGQDERVAENRLPLLCPRTHPASVWPQTAVSEVNESALGSRLLITLRQTFLSLVYTELNKPGLTVRVADASGAVGLCCAVEAPLMTRKRHMQYSIYYGRGTFLHRVQFEETAKGLLMLTRERMNLKDTVLYARGDPNGCVVVTDKSILTVEAGKVLASLRIASTSDVVRVLYARTITDGLMLVQRGDGTLTVFTRTTPTTFNIDGERLGGDGVTYIEMFDSLIGDCVKMGNVCVGYEDGTIRVFSLITREQTAQINHHTEAIIALSSMMRQDVIAAIDASTPHLVLHATRPGGGRDTVYEPWMRIALACPMRDSRFWIQVRPAQQWATEEPLRVVSVTAAGSYWASRLCECDRKRLRDRQTAYESTWEHKLDRMGENVTRNLLFNVLSLQR